MSTFTYSDAELNAHMVVDLIFEEAIWKGLPVQPDRITEVSPEFRTIITVFESGREQRACMQSKPKHTFKCLYHLLSADDINSMVLFHEQCLGSFRAFRFRNHHTNTRYSVRFKDDKLDFEYINSKFASLSFEVVTC